MAGAVVSAGLGVFFTTEDTESTENATSRLDDLRAAVIFGTIRRIAVRVNVR